MKTISIINLKGGVAKTITAINLAHILVTLHHKRVLLIDNDKQGNTSKFFDLFGYDDKDVSDILTNKHIVIEQVIKHTQFKGLDLITANMNLLTANQMLLIDTSQSRNIRLRDALQSVQANYDYCIIDNAPDLNMSVINALISTDDVIVPIKIDKFSFDGLEQLNEQIDDVKGLNPKIKLVGCLVTMFQKSSINNQGEQHLRENTSYPIFITHIRKTVKVDESTFSHMPLLLHSQKSTATIDYISFVNEYLQK